MRYFSIATVYQYWLLSTKMNVMKRSNARFCIREKFKIPAYWYA